jgi:tRNA uridine 5-carbamoylmethylation protein Kti12
MDKNPTNTGELYTVALASPLNFSGQTLNDDRRWQVPMLRLHHTHNFFNFREDCLLHFVVDKPAVANTVASDTASNKVIPTGDQQVDWLEFLVQERITHWVAESHIGQAVKVRSLLDHLK